MKTTFIRVTIVVLLGILVSGEEFKYTGDAVSIIYPQPGILTRRSSRAEDDDNIAVDSARVTSRIAPMRGKLYEPRSRATKPKPALTQVAADPGSERTEDDNTERRDETGDEDVENEERMESDVVSNDVESDPQNTYLQVGKWIAQWDAPYEAWYYYNSETGVSTWNKPRELETIEFTDPVPDIAAAKKKVQAAHKLKAQEIESEAVKGAGESVRLERDKPGHAHGHDHHHSNHVTANQQHHSSPVSFTNTSPLTHHNSLSLGPRPTSHPNSRPASQVSDPIFDQNFNRPTNKPQNSPLTLSQQLKLNQQKSQANSNYAGPTQQADTGYGSPTTEAPDAYGAPQADPVSSYDAPTKAPSYGAGNKAPVFEYTIDCLRRNAFSPWRRTSCFDWSEIFNSVFDGGVTRTGALIGIGAFILFNLIFYTAVIASGRAEGQFSLTRLLPQQLTNVFFEKRGFESLLEDFPDTDKILKLVQSIESEEWLSKTDTIGEEL